MDEKIVVRDEDDDSLSFFIVTAGRFLAKTCLYVEDSHDQCSDTVYVTPKMLETLASELQRVAKLMRSQSAMSDFMEIFTEGTPEILPFDGVISVNLLTTNDIADQLEGDLHE